MNYIGIVILVCVLVVIVAVIGLLFMVGAAKIEKSIREKMEKELEGRR